MIDSCIDFKKVLNNKISCKCGKVHTIPIKEIIIEKEALDKLTTVMKGIYSSHLSVHIATDSNLLQSAAVHVERNLLNSGYEVSKTIFDADDYFKPDEYAVGKLMIETSKKVSLLIAIGSGTINDIARFAAYKLDIPYIVVATAPSMDGYASSVSPIIKDGIKTTYNAVHPDIIAGDIDILSKAPMKMINAGFGDIMGKFTCLADWKISNILNDECYCESAVNMVQKALNICKENAESIANREIQGMKALMDALIYSGLAMLITGNSRPASGAEHLIVHYWEMKKLIQDKEHSLHGEMVGVATLLITKLYNKLFHKDINNIDTDILIKKKMEYTKECEKNYNKNDMLISKNDIGIVDEKSMIKKITKIKAVWSKLKEVKTCFIPDEQTIINYLKMSGSPISHDQIGVSSELLVKALLYSKDMRPRYTVLRLADELGMLRDISFDILNECQIASL